MALHTLNRAPSDSACLQRCLNAMSEGDDLLLIEDGVYCALSVHQTLFASLPANTGLFVLKADANARGLVDRCAPDFSLTDDEGFVDLCCKQDKVISWY